VWAQPCRPQICCACCLLIADPNILPLHRRRQCARLPVSTSWTNQRPKPPAGPARVRDTTAGRLGTVQPREARPATRMRLGQMHAMWLQHSSHTHRVGALLPWGAAALLHTTPPLTLPPPATAAALARPVHNPPPHSFIHLGTFLTGPPAAELRDSAAAAAAAARTAAPASAASPAASASAAAPSLAAGAAACSGSVVWTRAATSGRRYGPVCPAGRHRTRGLR